MTTLQRLANVSGSLNIARHIAPAGALWFATGVAAACTFATQVVLARSLAPSQFGAFASALATVMLLAPVAGFGLANYWLRLFGEEGSEAVRWIRASYRFLLLSTVLAGLLLTAWALLGPHDRVTVILLFGLSATILSQLLVELVTAKHQIAGKSMQVAVWHFAQPALRLTGLFILFSMLGIGAATATHAALVFSLVALLVSVASGLEVVKIRSAGFRPAGHPVAHAYSVDGWRGAEEPSMPRVAAGAWPFGVAGLLYFVYYQSGIILTKYITGNEAAGVYAAAFSIIAALCLLPGVIYQKLLLPKMHRWAYHDAMRLKRAYKYGNALMLVSGAAIACSVYAVAPWIIPWLFGEQFRGAIQVVRILALGVPFTFVAASAGAILSTRDSIYLKVRLMGVVAVCNLGLNALFIPEHGPSGAAIANAVSQAVLCALYVFCVGRLMVDKEVS